MHRATDWHDRLEIAEDGSITRILTAIYEKKDKLIYIDVYKENEYGECCAQNLYCNVSYGGYYIAFPGEPVNTNPYSYYYDPSIAEAFGFGECKKLDVGYSGELEKSDELLILGKYPAFRYMLEKKLVKSREDLILKLLIWKQYPEVEYILAAGFESIAKNKRFYTLTKPKKKKVIEFMRKYPQHKYRSLNEILQALKYSANDTEKYFDYLDCVSYQRRKVIKYSDYLYLEKQDHTQGNIYQMYVDYIELLKQSNHSMTDEYWRYPKNLAEKQSQLVAEQNRIKAAERRKLSRRYESRFKKYGKLIDGYAVFFTSDFSEWKKQASALNQCIVAAGYYDRCMNFKTNIVFIQKDGVPIATAEISNAGKMGQFYANELDRSNCWPSDEVRSVFNKWMAAVPVSAFAPPKKRKVKEVT